MKVYDFTRSYSQSPVLNIVSSLHTQRMVYHMLYFFILIVGKNRLKNTRQNLNIILQAVFSQP